MLLKQPVFSLIAVFTLALGIGATSAVFSLIQGVLLTPPPYRQPDRLVLIPSARADGQKLATPRGWAAAQWMEWQKEAKSLDGIAAYAWSFNFLVRQEGSESIEGMVVTRDYFKVTGLQPVMGRTFVESENVAGPPRVIILGYQLWQQKFNGDPHIIGKTVRISRWETPPTVIGVMPPDVRFLPSPTNAQEPNYNVNALVDFWIPVTPNPARLKRPDWDVVARLRDGATPPAGAGGTYRSRRQRGAIRARFSRDRAPGAIPGERIEPRRPPHPASPVGRGGAGAFDRVRQRCGTAPGARTAAAAGIRGAERPRYGPGGTFPAGVHRESTAGGAGRDDWRRPGVWRGQALQADWRARDSAPRCRHDWLAGAGMGIQLGDSGSGSCRAVSRASRLPARPDRSAEERRSEKQRGARGTPAVARSHDHADGIDAGVAGGRRSADSYHDEHRERAIGVQHRTNFDHECHGSAGRLGRFSPAGFGTGLGASGRAVRRLCLGSSPDRQQLARDTGHRRAAGGSQRERADRAPAALRHAGLLQAAEPPYLGGAGIPFHG